MEVVIFIALAVIFFIILNIQSSQRNNVSVLKKDLQTLSRQIQDLKEEIFKHTFKSDKTNVPTEDLKAQQELAEQKALEEQRQRIAAIEALQQEKLARKKQLEELIQPTVRIETNETIEPPTQKYIPPQPKENWLDKWTKNNPDLEKFIGENLFNKIGIAVLVLGIGFFVKYAIDKNWINEYGRVAIGLFCGIILIGLAHYLRKTYKSFSSVLAGGGIAVFYFTIALAFHQYGIIKQTPAFILMIVITGFAIALALLYDKLELAVIAAIGGFITPFLVSTGDGNYIVLFTYLIILNVGLLALSYFKKWSLINILALFFTILIYGGWMINTFVFKSDTPPYANALLFATIFYLLFLGMNMVYNISKQKPFKAFDFFLLLLINVTYFSAGIIILNNLHNGNYKGLFTIAMGVINFGLALYFFKTQKADKNLLYLLIGLTLTYLSLAAPIQLHGHSITLFWAAETVLLFCLFQRSKIWLFKLSSIIVGVLMLLSLAMDWQIAGMNENYSLAVIFTNLKGIITNIVAILAFVCYYFLLKKEEENTNYIAGISNKNMGIIFIVAAVLLTYTTCIFGINLIFSKQLFYTLPNIYHRLLSNMFALALSVFILPKLKLKKTSTYQIVLVVCCFLFYLGSLQFISDLRYGVLASEFSAVHLVMHWVSMLSLLVLIYFSIKTVEKNNAALQNYSTFLAWAFAFMVVFIFSFEFFQLYVVVFNNGKNIVDLQNQFTKAGLTILWAVCSFIMMWLGMKHKYKPLRIIAIVLFTMALLKLFLLDIKDIGPGGKIAAFILLGILLLAISFMYQRLKKILIDDAEK